MADDDSLEGCYNAKDKTMSPEEKFQHTITVHNRTYGPDKGTTISPNLDCEISPDNQRFLELKPSDVNMYHVLQQSNVKHGSRRKVAKRALTSLGQVSGVCGLVNGPKQMIEITAGLQFAASLENVRQMEKKRKVETILAKAKRKKELAQRRAELQELQRIKRETKYAAVRQKLSLSDGDQVLQKHVDKLTGDELRAVAHVQCGGKRLIGKVSDMRDQLRDLLPTVSAYIPDGAPPADDGASVPEYETQDDFNDEETTTDETELIQFEDLRVGEIVEVFWEGESQWFEGEVMNISVEERQYEVFYRSDSTQLWHQEEHYPVRMCI